MGITTPSAIFLSLAFGLSSITASAASQTSVDGSGQTRTWIRDTSYPEFGPGAWRDDQGLIWSNLLELTPSQLRQIAAEYGIPVSQVQIRWMMPHRYAAERCRSVGARLPSLAELERLQFYLGAEQSPRCRHSHERGHQGFSSAACEEGYRAQVLPRLTENAAQPTFQTFPYIWSRGRGVRTPVTEAYFFDGRSGAIRVGGALESYGVRCVRQR
jgi:hypothetical protein